MGLLANVKGSSLSIFLTILSMVERETRKRLKCLRSENGGEYTFKGFYN